MSHRYSSSDDTHAMVARIAPVILKLLSDGLPRNRHEIVQALAPQHAKDEVKRTLMRLSVTGRLVETVNGGAIWERRAEQTSLTEETSGPVFASANGPLSWPPSAEACHRAVGRVAFWLTVWCFLSSLVGWPWPRGGRQGE